MNAVMIDPAREQFSRSGKPFTPVGCNYFDPATGWAPNIWSQFNAARVDDQLAQIAEAGFNVIRIFLDVGTLQPEPGIFSPEGFKKVHTMTSLAEKHGLVIIYSGLNCWEGRPDYMRGDAYADPVIHGHIKSYWRELIRQFGQCSTIMTWDLSNEPSVGWPGGDRPMKKHRRERWQAWSRTDISPKVSGKGTPPDLWQSYISFQQHLATEWVSMQAETIREAGAQQLVTVGLIQWSVPVHIRPSLSYSGFDPASIADHLDYISLHFYPMLTSEDTNLDAEHDLQAAYVAACAGGAKIPGKPLVMQEFGWKGGTNIPGENKIWPEAHQDDWCRRLVDVTSQQACGWLNWAYADIDDARDISRATGCWGLDGKLKKWGQSFSAMAQAFQNHPPLHKPPEQVLELDVASHLQQHGGTPDLQWVNEHQDDLLSGRTGVKLT